VSSPGRTQSGRLGSAQRSISRRVFADLAEASVYIAAPTIGRGLGKVLPHALVATSNLALLVAVRMTAKVPAVA
jgi:L-amino acid N-acyltransferase YncA